MYNKSESLKRFKLQPPNLRPSSDAGRLCFCSYPRFCLVLTGCTGSACGEAVGSAPAVRADRDDRPRWKSSRSNPADHQTTCNLSLAKMENYQSTPPGRPSKDKNRRPLTCTFRSLAESPAVLLFKLYNHLSCQNSKDLTNYFPSMAKSPW